MATLNNYTIFIDRVISRKNTCLRMWFYFHVDLKLNYLNIKIVLRKTL